MSDAGARQSDTPTAERTATHEDLDALWADPTGWRGQFRAVQNDAIGMRLLVGGSLVLAGIMLTLPLARSRPRA